MVDSLRSPSTSKPDKLSINLKGTSIINVETLRNQPHGHNKKASAHPVYHTLRYDFKPASVNNDQPATLDLTDNAQVTIKAPNVAGSSTRHTVFRGQRRPHTKECLLIIDNKTGEMSLQRLTDNITVKATRSMGSSGNTESAGPLAGGAPTPAPASSQLPHIPIASASISASTSGSASASASASASNSLSASTSASTVTSHSLASGSRPNPSSIISLNHNTSSSSSSHVQTTSTASNNSVTNTTNANAVHATKHDGPQLSEESSSSSDSSDSSRSRTSSTSSSSSSSSSSNSGNSSPNDGGFTF